MLATWFHPRHSPNEEAAAASLAAQNVNAAAWRMEEAVFQRVFDVILRRERLEPPVPLCPDHHVEMRLRGRMGRPTRFTDQSVEQYTLLYFCPVEGCDQTATVERVNTQIPVPGESPHRPEFARRND